MRSHWMRWFIGGALGLAIFLGLYQIPAVNYRLAWRIDAAAARVRGWLYPGDTLPTPVGALIETIIPIQTHLPSPAPPTPLATLAPSPTPTPIPSEVRFEAPTWEKQDWNNCGPATLALGLRFYGWGGDQFDISNLLKPDRGDRNVNIDELVYYVRNRAGWLNAEIRVAGTVETLKRFLAAGYPVIVEKGYIIESEGPDAGWAGHYLLVTGYDDAQKLFITQDSFVGPDEEVGYAMLDEGWQAFNRVYMIVFPVDDQEQIESLLGPDADLDFNRERALQLSLTEVEADPENAFAWFNLGTNHLYFETYEEAALAYDRALNLGLPWRFTRYQFGPYIAYFNMSRFQDVVDLADATLYRTNKAEESMLWRGWARYRLGDLLGAIEDFRAALKVNPYYLDAQYALDYLGAAR